MIYPTCCQFQQQIFLAAEILSLLYLSKNNIYLVKFISTLFKAEGLSQYVLTCYLWRLQKYSHDRHFVLICPNITHFCQSRVTRSSCFVPLAFQQLSIEHEEIFELVQTVRRHKDHFRVCLKNYLPRERSLVQKYFKTPDLKHMECVFSFSSL